MKGFIRQEDVSLRLHQTICTYKGLPVFVKVSMDFPVNHVHVAPFLETRNERAYKLVDITKDDFSAKPPELGYVNYEGRAWYITRFPERRQRQGLVPSILSSYPQNIAEHYNTATWFYSQATLDMLTNTYPTLKEALERLRSGAMYSVAFHKSAAVSSGNGLALNLLYKGRYVANYDETRGVFTILSDLKDASFLDSILRKIGVNL